MRYLPSQSGGTPTDVVSQMVLRLMTHPRLVEALDRHDEEVMRVATPLLQRHAGIDPTEFHVCSRAERQASCERALADLSARLEMLPITPRDILAIEMAYAVDCDHVERMLLRLALYTRDHPDVRHAMNLAGPVDIDTAASLFARAIDIDAASVREALETANPLRLGAPAHGVGDTLPSTLIRLPDALYEAIRTPDATAAAILPWLAAVKPSAN